MKVIGITGGVGSGKSQVLTYMEENFHAVICQADHVAWELQMPGQNCYLEIVSEFGEGILNEDLTINRARLGAIVFSENDKLLKLNQIMHPAVKAEIIRRIQMEQKKGCAYFVVEAALLLEENYQQICDEIWYIYCDEITRRIRLKESRQYSDEKINSIMATQLSEQSFREMCQVTIDNSGEFEDTCIQIDRAMKR